MPEQTYFGGHAATKLNNVVSCQSAMYWWGIKENKIDDYEKITKIQPKMILGPD
jgi:hypothetical protein